MADIDFEKLKSLRDLGCASVAFDSNGNLIAASFYQRMETAQVGLVSPLKREFDKERETQPQVRETDIDLVLNPPKDVLYPVEDGKL